MQSSGILQYCYAPIWLILALLVLILDGVGRRRAVTAVWSDQNDRIYLHAHPSEGERRNAKTVLSD